MGLLTWSFLTWAFSHGASSYTVPSQGHQPPAGYPTHQRQLDCPTPRLPQTRRVLSCEIGDCPTMTERVHRSPRPAAEIQANTARKHTREPPEARRRFSARDNKALR